MRVSTKVKCGYILYNTQQRETQPSERPWGLRWVLSTCCRWQAKLVAGRPDPLDWARWQKKEPKKRWWRSLPTSQMQELIANLSDSYRWKRNLSATAKCRGQDPFGRTIQPFSGGRPRTSLTITTWRVFIKSDRRFQVGCKNAPAKTGQSPFQPYRCQHGSIQGRYHFPGSKSNKDSRRN